MSVKDEFSTGHFMMDYETVGHEFRYRLNISSAKHSDDGTYICSLIGTTRENGVTRQYTLMQSYEQTPNIFYASSKIKNQLYFF